MTTQNPIDLELLDATFGKEGREEIISTFVTHTNLLFTRITKSFEDKEIETIIDSAHQIKGMCASVYAVELSQQAKMLELMAKSDAPDWQRLLEVFAQIKIGFESLCTFISSVQN